MLAAREPVTLRALVEGTGASTMAVYTHFGGMPGLWSAVRQEGFTRLAARLAAVPRTDDAVHDLAALGVAYARSALAHPELYRAMFDAGADLADEAVADASFDLLVAAAARARDEGRLASDADPRTLATQVWAAGHGLVSLVVQGVLPAEVLAPLATGTTVALLTAAGDDADRCRASVEAAWAAG
ncbi:WHG domain-containing protein [Geodermatophilus normandii]|uniref:WHG domain-containing protein n=2 Tax=Geodermatophilus normandii TaxID=1137989 RepID=A0A6P0G8T5_9ACTN|nr:TetR-like C-terminal domain-containing protein [Geodermatophilus normandii]NEM04546.1 WHG domain-containing protein [Geodermatophilus normandii]